MPLAVKPLPNPNDALDEAVMTAEERLVKFVNSEIDRAVRLIDRRKTLAKANLDREAQRASKRIVTSGHRLERSLRATPLPVVPVAIGLVVIGMALLLSPRS